MTTNYALDGTYWTGRERDGLLEVVRLRSADGSQVQTLGAGYEKRGSAVTAAAREAYYQGRADEREAMRSRLHSILDSLLDEELIEAER